MSHRNGGRGRPIQYASGLGYGNGDEEWAEDEYLDIDLHNLAERSALGEVTEEEVESVLLAAREGRLRRDMTPSGPPIVDEDPDSVVYYLRFCCRVKIGTTTNLSKRLPSIPHDQLLAVEPGGLWKERRRHAQFAAERITKSSEWFNPSPALMAHTKALKSGVGELKVRLISTRDAVLYTGRDRQTLYRWAKEGRITKHDGYANPWDVWELPQHSPGEPIPLPPPLPS